MKKKVILIIAALLALLTVLGVVLGIRQCTAADRGTPREESDGSFNDPNALPWEPV